MSTLVDIRFISPEHITWIVSRRQQRIGDAAAESVREKYSIEFFARSVLNVYETALNERKTKEVKRNA